MPTPHNCAPAGAYAKTVLMPGDPLRAKYIADTFLTDVQLVNTVRNCLGFTGLYKGHRVSVQASGMGMPSIGIYSHELYTEYGVENIIRVGTAGSYSEHLVPKDVVLAHSAFSDSSFALVQNGCKDTITYPDPLLNDAILKTAQESGIECKTCRVHSSDVFYTAPEMGTFRDLAARTQSDCVEMESFALFNTAKMLGKKAACLLSISDSFVTGAELSSEERQTSLNAMLTLALEAAVALDK